jgi:hypothetical protein
MGNSSRGLLVAALCLGSLALTRCGPGVDERDRGLATDPAAVTVATDGGHDGGAPDGGKGDGGTPDSGTPDSGTPDSGTPDAGCLEPTYLDAQVREYETSLPDCADVCPVDAGTVPRTLRMPTTAAELLALAQVGDPPPPQPTGCRCPKVQIRCTGAKGDTAKCDPRKCVITFSAAECKNLGFTDGQEKDTDTLNPADVSKDTDQADIKDKCAASHEALHACQQPDPKTWWCNEKDGYNNSMDCIQRGMDANKCGAGPYKIPSLCNDLDVEKKRQMRARDYTQCRCDGKSAKTCLDECKGDGTKPLRVEWCQKIHDTYEPQAPASTK